MVTRALTTSVLAGRLRADAAQAVAAGELDRCLARLQRASTGAWLGARDPDSCAGTRVPRGVYLHGRVGTGKSMLMNMFRDQLVAMRVALPPQATEGLVARDGAAEAAMPVRRVHFHAFMLEVHRRIRDRKQALPSLLRVINDPGGKPGALLAPERDAITYVALQLAAELRVLCFDEFQVCAVCVCVLRAVCVLCVCCVLCCCGYMPRALVFAPVLPSRGR
jgi:predicted ATPase